MTKYVTKTIIAGGGLDFLLLAPKYKIPTHYLDSSLIFEPRRPQGHIVDVMKSGSRIHPSVWSIFANLVGAKDMANSVLRIRCSSSEDLIAAIKQHGSNPADYAAKETVKLARVFAWIEEEQLLYSDSPYQLDPLPAEYEPRWESPYLIWYSITYIAVLSDGTVDRGGDYISHNVRIE